MSLPTREDLLWRFRKVDDPEIEARRQRIIEVLMETSPQTKKQFYDKGLENGFVQGFEQGLLEGRLIAARSALRWALARRQLTPSKDDDTRIEACTDLATLERWIDRASRPVTVADLLE